MKPLVIYHANCADGFGAAFAAWLKLGDDADYVPMKYGKDADSWMQFNNGKVTGRDVYILDFSFDRQTMEDFFDLASKVVWLDHHKTAFEMWDTLVGYVPGARMEESRDGKHTVILDDLKSGAVLGWEYFHPDFVMPLFITHIDDYDRWQFKIEGTKAFNKALWSYAPWSFHQWETNFLAMDDSVEYHAPYNNFIVQGNAILRAHDQNVQAVLNGSARACEIVRYDEAGIDFMHLPGLAANGPPHLTSDVGHELAIKSGTFGLCWTLSQTGLVANCSLRSNGDYDVSAIAKVFGGGGHRNAAGFEVPLEALIGWLK